MRLNNNQSTNQSLENTYHPEEEYANSRFIVTAANDAPQINPYDPSLCYRHFDGISHHSTPAPVHCYPSSNMYYSANEYHYQSYRSESFDVASSHHATSEKFSFDDFEVLHAGDILALESPIQQSGIISRREDLSNPAFEVSSSSVYTHSDMSCDEYTVTSLDDRAAAASFHSSHPRSSADSVAPIDQSPKRHVFSESRQSTPGQELVKQETELTVI